ncbi:MAG: hypothetical protein AB1509_10825 [Chloroflexota bacterium]
MIRKLNYTDRVRIKREDIVIKLLKNDGQNWFDADFSRLINYGLPSESLLFVEAYRLTNWMRFNFGCVGSVVPPKDRHLKFFDSPAGIKFRVKVTAPSDTHKLLAEADAVPLIVPEEGNYTNSPLLEVMPSRELGDEIYRIDFSEGKPVLLINSEVANYKSVGRSPAFLSLALPAIFREILTRILVVDQRNDDNDMDDWHCRWIRFAKSLPGIGETPRVDEIEKCQDWIQDAVSVFARKQKLRKEFKEFWRDEQ